MTVIQNLFQDLLSVFAHLYRHVEEATAFPCKGEMRFLRKKSLSPYNFLAFFPEHEHISLAGSAIIKTFYDIANEGCPSCLSSRRDPVLRAANAKRL
jgi:hypothetical protein